MEELNNHKYIPRDEEEHKEIITVTSNNEKAEIKLKVKARPKAKHESEMWDFLREFEEEAWNPNITGFKTGFDSIDNAFDGGIVPGFIILGADSNIGKTAILSQIAYNIAKLNNDVYVMDFSLDDPFPDKVSRIVGCDSKITMNAVKNPKRYAKLDEVMERRKGGLIKLHNNADKYKIYDATFTTDIEKIEEEIVNIKIDNESNGVNKRIVVCIDNFHDLTSAKHPNYQDKQKYDYLSQACADIAIRHKIPLICTAELRKQNGTFRPSVDAIKESSKIKYEAKAIILCYNEVHYKGENSNIFFNRTNNQLKQPILELHFAKNKISSFKGRLFFESYPEMAFIRECSDKDAKTYSQIAYS